jgi:hypothetical protein
LVAPCGAASAVASTHPLTAAAQSPFVLQGRTAAHPEEPPHAQAVITRGSIDEKGLRGKEGSNSRSNEAATADGPPQPKLHPTRSRRLSHIYTAEVGCAGIAVTAA